MLANTLNNGDVANMTTVVPLLPDIQTYFLQLGHLEPTSGDLFEQFLITGMGAKPIVALYESQIQEFLASNPSYRDQITEQVRILYPQPTVWATHPLVVRSDNGDLLLTALKDPDIQRLAWARHGQRPGVPGLTVDPDVIPIPGTLAQVTSVTNMPALGVMDRILAEIAAQPPNAMTTPVPSLGATIAVAIANGRAKHRARLQLQRPRPKRGRAKPLMAVSRHRCRTGLPCYTPCAGGRPAVSCPGIGGGSQALLV
jgi:hypothetical protein